MRRIVLLAVAAVASLSACGGDGQPAPDADHDELARSYLLTLGSFPTGWSEVAPAGESRFFAEECGDIIAGGGRLGLAWTGDFINGAQSVQHVVAIFETEVQLLARLDSAGLWRDCVVEAIEGGKVATPGVQLSDPHFVAQIVSLFS